MKHRVGRAADRGIDANGVLKRRPRQNLVDGDLFAYQLNDAPTGELGKYFAAGIDGRDGGVSRHANPERFDHRSHRGGCAHCHAVPGRARHPSFHVEKVLKRHSPGLHLLAEAPNVRAGTDLAPLVAAVQHRTAGDRDGRQAAARSSHQQRRRSLIAADKEHDTVDWIAADQLLHVHRREIAEEHGRRSKIGFSERHHWELNREAARLQHAAADMFGEVTKMRVAGR